MFWKTDIEINAFETDVKTLSEEFGVPIYQLYYIEYDADGKVAYEQLLNEKVGMTKTEIDLLAVYILNRDRCIMLGDLITEVLEFIQQWINTSASDSIVMDWDSGGINVLR